MAKRLPPSVRNFKPPPPPPKPVDTFGLINLAREHRQPPPPGGGYMLVSPNATLTLQSATATGATTASLSVTSSIAGTLYWIVGVNATVPTAAQIQAGKDGTGATAAASGNQSMTAGVNNSTATGLVSNTAYNAFWTTDRNLAPPTATFATQFDPVVVTWAAAVVANGGTVSGARETAINAFVGSLKTDGVWTKIDRLWIMAGENSPSALTDLVATSLAVAHGAPTFAANSGYTGVDGSTTVFIDTGFNPATAGGLYTQNSAHLSMWSVGNVASVTGGPEIGNYDGASTLATIYDTFSDGNIYARINDASGSQGAPASRQGHWLLNRSDSTHSQIYRNGVNFASPNATSNGLASQNIYVLNYNNTGPGGGGNPNQVAMASIGGSLSSTDASNYYTRLRTLMTAIGVP